jgi:SAM-dependent methyltransferase
MSSADRRTRRLRSLAKRAGGVPVYRELRRRWVGLLRPSRVWSRALPDEVEFWREVLPGRAATSAEYRRRLDPESDVHDRVVAERLARVESETVSILDVGSGPLTALGKRWPGKTLSITPTDPLADEYQLLLSELGILPPVPSVRCRGEDLLDVFGPDAFDIAYAINSVDHAVDPVRVIDNMVGVVRPGGFVILRHIRREAVRNCYRHLHQWNFDLRDGDLLLWRTRRRPVNVSERLAGRASVSCEERAGGLVCVIEKVA